MYIVADGMGGNAAGEIASALLVETAVELFGRAGCSSHTQLEALIRECFRTAQQRILDQAAANPEQAGMGCTADLVIFYDGCYTIGHVGDSRTYRFREGLLEQLTSDHTLVQEQVEMGIITAEKARTHKMRNIITRAVGGKRPIEVDTLRGEIHDNDIFLLCSDGLHSVVEAGRLTGILAMGESLESKAALLVNEANEAGGPDNITVLLVAPGNQGDTI